MSEPSDEPLKTVVLNDAHVALGGRMVPFSGYSLPVQYPTGIMAEHKWTREHAGLFDVSHMGPSFVVLDTIVNDPDAEHRAVSAFVEPLVSGDIAGLKPGQLRYTLLLNDEGGTRDDLMIGRSPLFGGSLYVIVNAGTKDADWAHIDAHLGGRARLTRADDGALLALQGPDGRSYADRIADARTERELSRAYEDFVGMVPLGKRLFGEANPVHTGGPMQVSVAFAEAYAHDHDYPYPVDGSIRHEVFSRRGGLYFGIAHLLGYAADYPTPLYRFADYNAGFYASRNAAFQAAVTRASGIPLDRDGDLVSYGDWNARSKTELAVRTLAERLDLSDGAIHRDLAKGETAAFADTPTYARVYALADRLQGRPLPRAMLPTIRLESPKITRKLTTAWFAQRVDSRYRSCMARIR